MQLTCPCCHARASFEAFTQDESARDFMALVAREPVPARALVTYIGFFRSGSRALAWDRALRLAREVLELANDRSVLAAALAETCASLEVKRGESGWKPLTGHNYLKRVLESVASRVEVRGAVERGPGAAPTSRSGKALSVLEDRKHGR